MALWPVNLAKPQLAQQIMAWGHSVSAWTWAKFGRLGPATPERPTVVRNFRERRERRIRGVHWRMDKYVVTTSTQFEGISEVESWSDNDDKQASRLQSSPAPTPSAPEPALPPRPSEIQPAWKPAESAALTLAAEAARCEHARAVAESGEVFVPIADDDWETANPLPEAERDVEPLVPAAFDENNPDPFYYPPKAAQPLPTASQVHHNHAVYLIYMVVLWLHSSFHLPSRACSALLAIFALAFKAAGTPIEPAIHTTLPSVINQLGAEPSINILPVCPKCFEVYISSVPKDSLCSEKPRPHLQFPTKLLAEQLATLLSLPGMEEEIEKSLDRAKTSKSGKWTNIFDGKVCQELLTIDGRRFFFPSKEEIAAGELRIGVTMGMDWSSAFGIAHFMPDLVQPHQSSGASPGSCPVPTPDQCQRFLCPLINELLWLWKDGVVISTPKYPQGRLIRVALVAVVCDKPAMHKVGGFGSHSHTNFCTMCWIHQDLKASTKAFKEDGRLPSLIGEPAGGSLTADQWQLFVTVVAPLVIPQLWAQYIPDETPEQLAQRRAQEIAKILQDKKEAAAAAQKAKAAAAAVAADNDQEALGRGKHVRKPTKRAAAMDIDPDDNNGMDSDALDQNNDSDDEYGINPTQTRQEDEIRDNATPINLHQDDPGNFLKLCTSIKIFVRDRITEAELKLYREYCLKLIELYGPEVICPNHHYATHTACNICNYGPLNEFWMFLFLAQGTFEPSGSEICEAVQLMYCAMDDDQGTVQGLARNLDLARQDALTSRESPCLLIFMLPSFRIFNCLPTVQLHSYLSVSHTPKSRALYPQAFFFDHAIVKNWRYMVSYRSVSPTSSFVAVRVSTATNAWLWVGELCAVIVIKQDGLDIGAQTFRYVCWFRPTATDLSGTVWAPFESLTVQIWGLDEFTAAEDKPDTLISLQDIICHVARKEVVIWRQRYWATITVGTTWNTLYTLVHSFPFVLKSLLYSESENIHKIGRR
ncbi:hypothetical protein DFH07DRAFT_952551 [Mycena maculata]|uniref:Uncharacterized protein n=1 Tax=Mycena maculata TaxID=230809 RepID=A0AAD7K089_9AGAR|nr:hypothetical protein DFH07DRAFT_952551 [Mycena maculata]